jgi:hypothetical protein
MEGISMRRLYSVLLATSVAASAGILSAQDPGAGYYAPSNVAVIPSQQPQQPESCWQRFKRDYHRNFAWPEPFIAGDRAAVNVPFQIMADNAWERQNLMADYHFVEGTSDLNSAGLYRLRWIATKAPVQRRVVFVERATSDATTIGRITAVQNALLAMNPHGPMLPVYESRLGPGDWSGEQAATTVRNMEKTSPDPRLPKANPTAISN